MAKIAIIYYSATGNVHTLAHAVDEGARSAGAQTRLRHVAELAPEEAIAQNAGWVQHRKDVADEPVASLDDLEWADAYILGSPTRYGNVSAQLKQFIDTTGGLWSQGKLSNKVASGFTSSMNVHGGQESTLLALYNTFHHWGAYIVTTGYTDERTYQGGGNPYGPSSTQEPTDDVLDVAKYLGERVASVAAKLTA